MRVFSAGGNAVLEHTEEQFRPSGRKTTSSESRKGDSPVLKPSAEGRGQHVDFAWLCLEHFRRGAPAGLAPGGNTRQLSNFKGDGNHEF